MANFSWILTHDGIMILAGQWVRTDANDGVIDEIRYLWRWILVWSSVCGVSRLLRR